MSQLVMWLLLLAGIVVGPTILVLGFRWYERRQRHGRRRRRGRRRS